MSKIKFDFYKNPDNRTESMKSQYHVRICNRQSVSTQEIVNRINKMSTLTAIDIKAVITAFQDEIAFHLGQGKTVRLEGLCDFSITLTTKGNVCTGEENASDIVLKSVNIVPQKGFTEKVKENLCEMEKVEGKHSGRPSETEIDNILTEYFRQKKTVTRAKLQDLCQLTKYMSISHIKRLVAEGKLVNIGFKNHPLYVPAPGFYGA